MIFQEQLNDFFFLIKFKIEVSMSLMKSVCTHFRMEVNHFNVLYLLKYITTYILISI